MTHKYEPPKNDDRSIIFRWSFWSKRLNKRIYAKGKPFPIRIKQD